MRVNAADGAQMTGAQGALGMGEDAQTKNIKKQIARVQKQLQDLAANDQISVEEKMKKRQELQKQLTELNGQLRQHQIEQRRKASEMEKKQQQNQAESMNSNAKQQYDPAAEMILSADAALKQAKTQDSVIATQKGRAGVLEAEIKLDSGRKRDVSAKREELAEVEARMTEVQSAQIKSLSDVSKHLKEEQEKSTQKDGAGESKVDNTDNVVNLETEKEEEREKEQVEEEKNGNASEKQTEQEATYRPINILL